MRHLIAAFIFVVLCADVRCLPDSRSPALGINALQSAVDVNGEVATREWVFSAAFPSPVLQENPRERDGAVVVRAQYDDARCYFAFNVTRPKGYKSPRVVPGTETQDFAEDLFRITIVRDGGTPVDLICNAAGLKNAPVPAGVICKTRITPDGWEGELAVDCRLAKGARLLFGYSNEQATPVRKVSYLAGGGGGERVLWEIVPRDAAPVVSFLPSLLPSEKGLFRYEIISNTNAASALSARFRVLASEPVGAAGQTNKPVAEAPWQVAERSLIPFGRSVGSFSPEGGLGKYFIEYAFFDRDDVVVRGTGWIVNQDPFSVKWTPYFLTSACVELEMESGTGFRDGTVSIRVVSAKNGKMVEEQSVPVRQGMKTVAARISTSAWNAGEEYMVFMEMKDSGGNVLAAEKCAIIRPANPSWHRSTAGLKPGVPAPWTPVVLNGSVVSVWGRETVLGESLLPRSIVSSGKNLLTAPADLFLEINGKTIGFSGCRTEVREKSDERVVLTALKETDQFSLEVTLTAEFDGYMWYEAKIIPKTPIRLERAGIRLLLEPSCAGLFHVEGKGTVRETRGTFLDDIPHGATPLSLVLPFHAFVWLGCEDAGLQYFCESARFWNLRDEAKAIEIRRGEKATEFMATFVDSPAQISCEVVFGFGLMASPVRPMGRRDRFWSANTLCWYGYSEGDKEPETFRKSETLEAFTERVIKPWKESPPSNSKVFTSTYRTNNVRLAEVYGWNPLFGAPINEDPLFNKKFAALAAATKAAVPEMKIAPYTGWGVNARLSFWDAFGMEMTRRPFEVSGWDTFLHCANSSFADFFADSVARMIRDYGVDGPYLDSTGNVPCCNRTGHGCGYYNEKGVLHGTYPIRATRAMFKRLYKITHGEVIPDGIVYLHGGFNLPVAAFCDLLLTYEPAVAKWKDLESIDTAKFRANGMGDPYGIPVLICWHYFSPHLKLKTNEVLGYILVHGGMLRCSPVGLLNYANGYQQPSYALEGYPLRHVYLLMETFSGGSDVQFHPYWKKDGVLSVDRPEVLASFYTNAAGKALVVLCNTSKAGVNTKVRLTLPGGVHAVKDAFLGTAVETDGSGEFATEIGPQGYRLLLAE